MFKNFDKVFKFTFRNQVMVGSYRALTIITAICLFLIPVAIIVFSSMFSSSDEEDTGIESCGAERIYVVNEIAPDADYNVLSAFGVEGYTDITYINADSVESALGKIEDADDTKSFVLYITKSGNQICTESILPENSELTAEQVEYYDDFIAETGNMFSILSSGIDIKDLNAVMVQSESAVYSVKGYADGTDLYADKEIVEDQENSEILPVFNMIIIYVSIMVIYMVIIFYGNSIMQNVILEKTSKLMDTMLISVDPKSMIFGKMLAILLAGFIQLLSWIAAIALGIFAGIKIVDITNPGTDHAIITFLKSFSEMNLFRPANVIIGVLALIFGIVMYSSLSAMAGAISSSREEAASNQGIFIMLLVIAFYLVLFKGMNTTDVATWLYILPITSAMVLPAGICTGLISFTTGAIGLALLIVCSLVFIWLAGKFYTMMSLYKGNKINIVKAFKMLAGKQ